MDFDPTPIGGPYTPTPCLTRRCGGRVVRGMGHAVGWYQCAVRRGDASATVGGCVMLSPDTIR